MTNSAIAGQNGSQGAQRPRISSVPSCFSSQGREAVELVRLAGLELDPWEQHVLIEALGETEDQRWAAFEVGVVAPRQNGKDEILTARILAGLFLLEERLIISSAHQFDTSLEAFRRLLRFVEETPEFERRVKRVSRSHGEEGIELKSGQRVRFRTRTKGGGRGFTADCLILNEAMDISTAGIGALLPTLSARPNPQVWYAGSAVDQWIQQNGAVLARVRDRGLKGDDPSLAYFEWSVDCDDPEKVGDRASDPQEWAQANPGLGIRISPSHIENERHSMDPRTFAVERLGVGDWPDPEGSEGVIRAETWAKCADKGSEADDPVCLAFDVTPDRSFAAVAVAGLRSDGETHIEVISHRRGTDWVGKRLEELTERHDVSEIVCDGPARALVKGLENRGIEVRTLTTQEYAESCGSFFDACEQNTLHHLSQPELDAAVKGAAKRPLGDAWAWSRKTSSIDISPLVACTEALWALVENQVSNEPWVMVGS